MNILIVGHDSFENKGCQALIYTTTRMLKNAFPAAVFKIFSWNPQYDAQSFNQSDIPCEFIRHKFNTNEFSPRNRFWLFLNQTLKIRTDKILYAPQYFYDVLNWSKMVVVSGGDILGDYGEAAVKHYFFPIAVAVALGKLVYVFGQSISPYKDPKLQRFCKDYLDKVSLITVREQLSYDYMKDLKVKAPLHLTADPAFTLKPCPAQRMQEIGEKEGITRDARPLIGFSVSQTVTRWGGGEHGKFAQEMANAINILSDKDGQAHFVFIPHVTYRNDAKNDDRVVGREIYEKSLHKDRVCLVEGDYDCQELKGLIGLCDVFVGARTHATIASTSQLVPTIALAYSTKAYGIMEEVFDKERCVLDIKEFSADKLVMMVEILLSEKDQVGAIMAKNMERIRRASLRNGELAKGLFS
ncbi:MAG: polysaccharide pyruvyl transferase family protein [Deltaproteobacteria bacterium]|nr:polysaccharide pyruvyl transferase family protein [Deltaproteobacteria bacterium]